jgi:hypothetical protein
MEMTSEMKKYRAESVPVTDISPKEEERDKGGKE